MEDLTTSPQLTIMKCRPTKKNLLLAFDAFGTLFTPRDHIAIQYGDVGRRHGLIGFKDDDLYSSFRRAYKEESSQHPNFGKKVGMKAPEWWANVISKTFKPLVPDREVLPDGLVPDLLHRFSSKEGYRVFPDTLPFFQRLKELKASQNRDEWPYQRTIVGVITNSDDRIPGILESFGLKVSTRRHGSDLADSTIDEDEDINFAVLSYDVGYEKPEKEIFEAAERLVEGMVIDSGSSMADFDKVFVGDEPTKDAKGASAAGWRGICINRSESSDSPEPEFEVISDLGMLIDSWKAGNG